MVMNERKARRLQPRNPDEEELHVPTMEQTIKPEPHMAGAHSDFFGGKEVDLKTELTEELAEALADAAVVIETVESRELAIYCEELMRKRVSLSRSSRKEWVRIGTAVTKEEGDRADRGLR